MKKVIFLFLIFISAYGITIGHDSLPNGLIILTIEAHKIPEVEMRAMVRAGSVLDAAGEEGLANLVSQLLLRGTKNRSGDEIAEEIEYVGGEFSSFTNEDYVCLYGKVLSKDLNILIEILHDCLQNPSFDSLEFMRLKKEIVSKIKADEDDPLRIGEVSFRKLVFGEHPLNHLPEGFDSTVEKITIEKIKKFYENNYLPNNTFLVFVGDFNRDSLMSLIKENFSNWQRKSYSMPVVREPVQLKKPLGKIIKREVSQAYILLGFPGPGYMAQDWIATRVMNYILGGAGLTSRLYTRIREERGLAYVAYSYFARFLNGGYFAAEVQTKKVSANEVVQIIVEELARMKQGARQDELETAKKYYIGHFPLTYDTYREMADLATQIEIEHLGVDYLLQYENLVSIVSLDDVKSVAQKYLYPESFFLLIVGDIKKEDIAVSEIEWRE